MQTPTFISFLNRSFRVSFNFDCHTILRIAGGKIRGGVNEEGITYYNNLINELLANGNVKINFTIFQTITN